MIGFAVLITILLSIAGILIWLVERDVRKAVTPAANKSPRVATRASAAHRREPVKG